MSDYKHEKLVRFPFPKDMIKGLNFEDIWDFEPYLRDKLGDLYDNENKNSFRLECIGDSWYIDWLYYSTYGEQSGDWGSVRLLTQKELDVIVPYFNKLEVVFRDEDLRVVEYCYYNGAEPDDHYNLDLDDSNLFITKE
jgi:hypothetical protein